MPQLELTIKLKLTMLQLSGLANFHPWTMGHVGTLYWTTL
jgi:hypothetical protein